MKFLILLTFVIASSDLISAKIYTKCELAKKLNEAGIPRSSLPDWVCLVKHESNFNSRTKGPQNKNLSYDWGIFQINDRYWCGANSVAGDCKTKCSIFINDDIADDITCAKKIFNRHNFDAWYGWKNNCKGRNLSAYSVNECF